MTERPQGLLPVQTSGPRAYLINRGMKVASGWVNFFREMGLSDNWVTLSWRLEPSAPLKELRRSLDPPRGGCLDSAGQKPQMASQRPRGVCELVTETWLDLGNMGTHREEVCGSVDIVLPGREMW